MNPTFPPAAGVLFDFDGVVVDSRRVHEAAWEIAFRELFGAPLPNPYPSEHRTGSSSLQVAEHLASAAGQPGRSAELARRKLDLLLSEVGEPDVLPGARELLEHLNRKGIPYGIASNAPARFLQHVASRCGLAVRVMVGYDDIARPKPAPDAFVACAARAGIPESEYGAVYVFEDSTLGIAAAVAAGMVAVGVETSLSAARLLAAGAVRTCPALSRPLHEGWF